jgi:hypothetical protein
MSKKNKHTQSGELILKYALKDEDRISELFELINQNISRNISTDALVLKELTDIFQRYSLRSFNAALYLELKNAKKAVKRIKGVMERFNYSFNHSHSIDVDLFHLGRGGSVPQVNQTLKVDVNIDNTIKHVVTHSLSEDYDNLDAKVEISKCLMKYLKDNKVSYRKFSEYKRKVLAAVICESLGYAVFSGKKKDAKASEYENSFSHHYKKGKAELGI